jgi:hypothetical protein
MPHIFDSVVLTKSSFDNGLLGSHIAAFYCGVNVSFLLLDFLGLEQYQHFQILLMLLLYLQRG